jgi:2-polyprenyl-3-methyl-5-hydroxy-6-metoxy-1,4-benzoquinol methylase
MDVKEQDILGEAIGQHWYYRAKGGAMRRLLGARPVRHVLDVGAGSGVFSKLLLEHGAEQATCVDPAYPIEQESAHAGRPIRFVHQAERSDADVVLLMDVLEHVDDDTGLLREYATPAAPGTRFLMTVPAFQWMWSGHDVFLEHRRRYTLPMLEAVVREAGLVPVTGCYFYGLTLPLAAARRAAKRLTQAGVPAAQSDLKRHSGLVNAILYGVCRAEMAFFDKNRMAGLSVFCLAERRTQAA